MARYIFSKRNFSKSLLMSVKMLISPLSLQNFQCIFSLFNLDQFPFIKITMSTYSIPLYYECLLLKVLLKLKTPSPTYLLMHFALNAINKKENSNVLLQIMKPFKCSILDMKQL